MSKSKIYTDEELKAKKAKRHKDWYEKNKEEFNKKRRDYRKQHKEEMSIISKNRYSKDRKKMLLRVKKYYKNNKEKILEYQKKYRIRNKQKLYIYRLENKSKLSENTKKWIKNNQEKARIIRLNRIAKKKLLINDFSDNDKNFMLDYFNYKCCYCKKELNNSYHLDHFIPISKNGGTTKTNILPSCPNCNLRKNNKNPYEWILEHFNKEIIEEILQYFSLFKSD